MPRVIFHVDMDAFYASIEQRDQPSLRGLPVIVGSPPHQRGVVCAASYEARRFGVRSAMPSATARRLCPRGIFVTPRMERYRQESRKIMGYFERVTPVVEKVSIDEAYLDVSQSLPAAAGALEGLTPEDGLLYRSVPLARELQARIFSELELTASIGIAANKFLSKVASDFQKPKGLTVIPESAKVEFLRPMPVRIIFGVGPVTEKELQQAGIHTVGDLQDFSGDLRPLVGSFAPALKRFAFGRDDRPVDTSDEVKSISSEETFQIDTTNPRVLRGVLRASAQEIAQALARRQLAAHTVQVRVRYADFQTLTRQTTMESPVTEAEDIYRLACFLMKKHQLVCRPLRLLGVGVSNLGDIHVRQLSLL